MEIRTTISENGVDYICHDPYGNGTLAVLKDDVAGYRIEWEDDLLGWGAKVVASRRAALLIVEAYAYELIATGH